MSQNQNDYYKNVAEKLIEQLKAGTAPWQRPWTSGQSFLPHNPVSGTRYKGGNTIALMVQAIDKGYSDSRWMTYEQAKNAGGQVRKGEKGTVLRFFKFTEDVPVVDEGGKPIRDAEGKKVTEKVQLDSPKVCSFVVFNAQQIEGLPPPEPVRARTEWEINSRAEQLLKASGARISFGGERAYYNYQSDEIRLPPRESFTSDGGFYATALHEVGHWSGHKSRLDRDMRHPFGSVGYAKEELRAEIFSMMLGDEIGLRNDPEQHAAYVGSWIKVLQEDYREIFRAAADSEKMMGFVLNLERSRANEQCVVVRRTFDMDNKGELISEVLLPKVGLHDDLFQEIEHERIWSNHDADPEGEFSSKHVIKISDLSDDIRKKFFDDLEANRLSRWEPEALVLVKNVLEQTQTKSTIALSESKDMERIYLNVPFSEKEEAKSLGASWDKVQKSWFIKDDVDKRKFEKWLGEAAQERIVTPTLEDGSSPEKIFLAVPYVERFEAKKLGAKWDVDRKSWFVKPDDDLQKFEKWLDTKVASAQLDPVEEFSIALKDAGLLLDGPPVMDGQLHRVPVVGGDHGSKDGAYTGHLDGRPAGFIQNFKSGVRENWKSQGFSLSEFEKAKLHAEASQNLERRQKEREDGYENVSHDVSKTLKELGQAHWDHPYIFRKNLSAAHGALFDPIDGAVVLPASDINGKTWSYQKISEDGSKSFAAGGRISGCMFVATSSDLDAATKGSQKVALQHALGRDRVYIAEGYATAASLAESLKTPVIAAFSSGNLEEVARAIRSRLPKAEIIICGDDDRGTEAKQGRNPGKEKAIAAAKAVNGRAVFPVFPPGKNQGTDFNDLHKFLGLESVKDQVRTALAKNVERSPSKEIKPMAELSL